MTNSAHAKNKNKRNYLPNNHRHFFARVSARLVCAKPKAVGVLKWEGISEFAPTNSVIWRRGWDGERARDERKLGWIMIENDFTKGSFLLFVWSPI